MSIFLYMYHYQVLLHPQTLQKQMYNFTMTVTRKIGFDVQKFTLQATF